MRTRRRAAPTEASAREDAAELYRDTQTDTLYDGKNVENASVAQVTGMHQRSYSTPSQVTTEMGDRSRVCRPGRLCDHATQANSAWPFLGG